MFNLSRINIAKNSASSNNNNRNNNNNNNEKLSVANYVPDGGRMVALRFLELDSSVGLSLKVVSYFMLHQLSPESYRTLKLFAHRITSSVMLIHFVERLI